jgi:hypothetical protein
LNSNARETFLDRLRRNLGEDAREVVSTLLFGPVEFLEELFPGNRRPRPERVRAELASGLDWQAERFDAAWQEVEAAL